MALYEYANDLDTPVHPVSPPDYILDEQARKGPRLKLSHK